MKVTMTVDANDAGGTARDARNKTLLDSLEMLQRGIWQAYFNQDDPIRRIMEYVHVRIYFGGAEFTVKLSGKADGMDWNRETNGRLDNRKPDPSWPYPWSADGVALFVCSKIKELLNKQRRSYEAAVKTLELKVVTR